MRLKSVALTIAATLILGLMPVQAAPAPAYSKEMDEAMALFYQEKFEESAPLFEQVLKQNPQHTLAMSYLLHAYYRMKETRAIVSKIEQRAVARGEDPTTVAQLGLAYFMEGMLRKEYLDEALNEFKNAIESDSSLAMAYTGMGMVYFQKRMMPRSKGYFIRALRLNPHDIMALDRLGNILLVDEKKPQDAKELFERIIAELPSYPDGHYYVGSSMFDMEQYESAIPYLTKCRELDPKGITQGFDAATLLGECYVKTNRKAEAIDAFEFALTMRPDSKYVDYKLREIRGELDE